MTYYTHYWSYRTADTHEFWGAPTYPATCDHTAGNVIRERGVSPGDTVYVISFRDGRLRVLGRMVVSKAVDLAEATRILPYEPWDAYDHLIARRGTATPLVFDAWLKKADTKRLEFVTPAGQLKPPKLRPDRSVNPQTFRGFREITPKSAAILDSYLP